MTHGKIEKLSKLSTFRTTLNILITQKIITINANNIYTISDLFFSIPEAIWYMETMAVTFRPIRVVKF